MADKRAREQDPAVGWLLFGVGVAGFALGTAVAVQVGAAAAAGLFGGGWSWTPLGEVPGIIGRLVKDPGAPAAAFPTDVAAQLPASSLPLWLCIGASVAVIWLLLIFLAVLFVPMFRHRPGFAKPMEVTRLLGQSAVRRRAVALRPELKKSKRLPATVGGPRLCRLEGVGAPIHATLEDSVLVVGPQGSGKTTGFMIPAVAGAPGAVISTSTKPDVLMATAALRMTGDRVVHVFDPQQSAAWPDSLRWSPVRGCENPVTAMVRAAGFAEGGKSGKGVTNGDFWAGQTTAVLRCYLHAAAIAGLTIADVLRWSRNPRDEEPVSLLRQHGAPAGWADELLEQGTASTNQVGSVWAGVRRSFDCLSDPRVLEACSPGPREEFSPEEFLRRGDTLYLLGTNKGQISVAPLITALIEDIVEVARHLAAHSPGERLEQVLTLALDEVAQIAPLPSLPFVMGDGRGQGIQTIVILQSLAQARSRWGTDEAEVIWDTATCRLILPGMGNQRDAKMISDLLGQYNQTVTRTQSGRGGPTRSREQQAREVMAINEIRSLKPGRCLVIYRHLDAIMGKMMFSYDRPDKARFDAAMATARRITGRTPSGPQPSPVDTAA